MFCPFFVFGTFLTGLKGLCFHVGTKMQQANRILNGASSLTSHLIIGIASWWFRAGCLGLFRFWFGATLICVPCFPPPRKEKNTSPQKLVGKKSFSQIFIPQTQRYFLGFWAASLSPLYFVKIKSFNGSVEFPEIPRINIFFGGTKDMQQKIKKIPRTQMGRPLCFDWSWGLALEGWPSKNRDQLGSRYIYHGPPKPTCLEVFIVNNLVFRWPKPFFFRGLYQGSPWKSFPHSPCFTTQSASLHTLAAITPALLAALGNVERWELGGKKGTQMGTNYKAENEY